MDGTTKQIIELYKSGLSTLIIGKQVGFSHTKVIRILEENGIKRRNKKEALLKYAKISTCIICGKQFRARDNWKSTKNSHNKTCSRECLGKFLSKLQRENNSNIIHGGSQARYQRIRKELKPDICEWCGATPPTRLDTHHKDRNKSNNTKENLMVLCVSCHAYLHYIEDDRGLRGWKKI